MPKTAKGIYHDLTESEYRVVNNGVRFYFSSKLYKRHFLQGYMNHRRVRFEQLSHVLMTLYTHHKDRMNLYFDIDYYIRCEKRGFRMTYKGSDFNCLQAQKFALRNTIDTSIIKWLDEQKQK